jgi:hypothetical protein
MHKHTSKRKNGSILIDILLAFSLSAIFIVIITQSSFGARDIFTHAKIRNGLISIITDGSSTLIDTRSSSLSTSTQLFGNDRLEKDISASLMSRAVSFTQIEAKNPLNLMTSVGTPLCSIDFQKSLIQGIDHSEIIITPISLPIDPLLPLTDFQVRNHTAYVSTDSTKSTDPDLLVVDFTDISNPHIRSSINTGPGISAIILAGNRIFAAVTSTIGQLQSIRLNSQDSLTLENSYKLPLPLASSTPTRGSSIFYHHTDDDRDFVYLGTEKWDGEEFSIIDVTDPLNPTRLGSFETGTKINDIAVSDFSGRVFAYISDADQQQFRILDITNPSSPVLASGFSPSGWSRQEGNVTSIFENTLSLGRTSGGFDIKADPELFVSNQDFWSGSIPENLIPDSSKNIAGGVYGIIQDRSHVYVASRDVDKEFQVFDRSLATSSARYFSLPVAAQRLTCDGDYLYVLAASAPVIYEITFK